MLTHVTPPAKCPDCGHDPHEFVGCTGDPTPSDLWAGVSVSACDCSGLTSPEGCAHDPRYSRSECVECGRQEAWCDKCHVRLCGCPTSPAECDRGPCYLGYDHDGPCKPGRVP